MRAGPPLQASRPLVTKYFPRSAQRRGVSRWNSWEVRWRPTVIQCHGRALMWWALESSGWGYVTWINMPSFRLHFSFFFVTFLSCLFSFFCCAGSNFSRYRGPHLRVDPDSVYFLSRPLSLPPRILQYWVVVVFVRYICFRFLRCVWQSAFTTGSRLRNTSARNLLKSRLGLCTLQHD